MDYKIFDNLLESVFAVNSDLSVIYANEAFSLLIQTPLKRFLRKKKISEVMTVTDKDMYNINVLLGIDEPTPYREISFTTPRDSSGKVQYSIQKVLIEGDIHFLYFLRDVTLEEQLQVKYKQELIAKEGLIEKLKDTLLETRFRYKINEITSSSFNINEVIGSLAKLFKDLFKCEDSTSIIFDGGSVIILDPEGEKTFLDSKDMPKIDPSAPFNNKVSTDIIKSLLKVKKWGNSTKDCYTVPLKSQKNILGILVFFKPRFDTYDKDKMDYILASIHEHINLVLDNFLLYERSVRDGLTNLYNVRFFKSALLKEMKRSGRHEHPCSIILCDIDYFKKVNDTYGHPTGDQVLKNIAQILLDSTRESDIVSRYGGEEFAIMLPETDAKGALSAAEKIRKFTEDCEFQDVAGKSFPVTLSLGISCFPENTEASEELIELADKALYRAKNQGRNRSVVYTR